MSKLDRLPPMQALSMFEAAARLASFSAAARELDTTQPAVSQRIVQLEESLGVPLFHREHRGVRLTDDGKHLLDAVRQGLDTIRSATETIRRGSRSQRLSVSTDFGFATYWLIPRLPRFKALMPDVDVRIVTSQTVFDSAQAQHDGTDIAIAFGDIRADWGTKDVIALFSEQVTPVCSPAFLARYPEARRPEGVAGLPLLHLAATKPERWLSWEAWFASRGVVAPTSCRKVTLDSYALVTHAAIMGQGVALGWAPFVDPMIESGQLVALDDVPVVTPNAYLLATRASHMPAIGRFRQWVIDESGPPANSIGALRPRASDHGAGYGAHL